MCRIFETIKNKIINLYEGQKNETKSFDFNKIITLIKNLQDKSL